MKRKRNTRPLIGGYYFCYFAAQACMASGLNVYLSGLGFDGADLGRFNGITALVPVLLLPAVGWWVGRWPDQKKTGWLLTGSLGALLLAAGLMGRQREFWPLLGWGVLWEGARSLCVAMADRQTMGVSRSGGYGGFRAWGSLGFLVGGTALGFAARFWGLGQLLFPVYLALIALGLLCSFAMRGGAAVPASNRGGVGALLRNPAFRWSLLIGVQGSVAVSGLQPYLGTHLVNTLGAPESILGWNTLCCAGPELILLPWVSKKLLPRYGVRPLLVCFGVGLSLRCCLYALAPTPAVFLVGSLFYALSVCSYTAVNLAFLKQILPEEQYAAGILIQSGVSALGRAVFGWLFGFLCQHWGSGLIFWVLLALAAGTTVIFATEKAYSG